MLIDPAGEPTQAPYLSIHLPRILIDRDPTTGRIDVRPVPDDARYSPLVRKPALQTLLVQIPWPGQSE